MLTNEIAVAVITITIIAHQTNLLLVITYYRLYLSSRQFIAKY